MNFLTLLWQQLSGKKTYLIAIAAFSYGTGISAGWWPHSVPLDIAFASLSAAALRAGIGDKGTNGGNGGNFPRGSSVTPLIVIGLIVGAAFLPRSLCAQDLRDGPAPVATEASAPAAANPTLQGGLQQILDSFQTGLNKWYLEAHGLYAPKLQKKYGGGLGFFYPLSDYVVAGVRCDWVNGGFWMPSGNATLQVPLHPLKFWPQLTVTPFGYAGIGVPISGAKFGDFTVPGKGTDNNGDPTAILGYGAAVTLGAWNNWTFNALGDVETWSGFPGNQYRFGLALHRRF